MQKRIKAVGIASARATPVRIIIAIKSRPATNAFKLFSFLLFMTRRARIRTLTREKKLKVPGDTFIMVAQGR
jgi:hypothetical protein